MSNEQTLHDVILRDATIDDLPWLLLWDEQEHVIASDPNDDWDWEEELKKFPVWRRQLMAEVSGRPIGFVQIIDPYYEETHYWGTVHENLRAIDIWIGDATDLGNGYGTQMMHQAIDICFEDPLVTSILIDPLHSNTNAIRFYERFGFSFIERRKFGEDDCCVYELQREYWGK
ncbi:MAG: GNAT family N-acetyltransferase [Sphingobacteriales bacterium]|nr:MAG: GNAT family N-acetyltransferase [Sphingobacteriales bacterium]